MTEGQIERLLALLERIAVALENQRGGRKPDRPVQPGPMGRMDKIVTEKITELVEPSALKKRPK